jgi:hypothetical protein
MPNKDLRPAFNFQENVRLGIFNSTNYSNIPLE